MSISMGLIGKGFSIVAADTRTMNIIQEKPSDEAKKLFQYESGWVATCGGVAAHTTLFEAFLNTYKIKTRKQLYNAWLITVRDTLRVAKECLSEKEYNETDMEMNSTNAFVSINYFNGGSVIEINSLDFAYGRRKLCAENSLIVHPPKLTKRIKRLIKEYTELARNVADVYEAVYTMACLLNEISRVSNWVSKTLDCGISIQISDNEIVLLRLREHVKDIIKQYKQKHDLSEKMMVCGIKKGW